MADISEIGALILGTGGLFTSFLAVYYARSNRKKTDSESNVNLASAKEIEERAATLNEERYQMREKHWSSQVEKIRNDCHEEVEALREEIAWLKILIENHVPWDWEQMKKLSLAGIDYEKPPTLNYIKVKRPQDKGKDSEAS